MRLTIMSAALLLCACPGEDPVPAKDTPKAEPKEAAKPEPAPLPPPPPAPSLPLDPAAKESVEGGAEAAVLPAKDPGEAAEKPHLSL